jgi:hypothetical protein
MTDTGSEQQILADIESSQKQVYSMLSDELDLLEMFDAEPYSKAVIEIASKVAELASIFSPDPVASAVSDIFDKLHQVYVALNAENAATQLLAKKTFLNTAVSGANTALADLALAVNDPETYPPGSLIISCQTSLDAFLNDHDLIWNSTYAATDAQKIYWSDVGQQSTCFVLYTDGPRPVLDDAAYGAQEPPLNDDEVTVFDYRMSLPVYLWLINVYLAVGLSLDPSFNANMKPALVSALQKLKTIYDKVVNEGLTTLAPPSWTGDSVVETACPQDPANPAKPRPAIQLQYDRQFDPHHPVAPKPIGAQIEYGVVEKFSGVFSIDDNYQIDLTTIAPNDAATFNKMQLRLLARTKAVYVTCGMEATRHAIDRLGILSGNPGIAPPSLAGWSFKEILATAGLRTGSLRGLTDFIVNTQPNDMPPGAHDPHGATSLRALLTPAG